MCFFISVLFNVFAVDTIAATEASAAVAAADVVVWFCYVVSINKYS